MVDSDDKIWYSMLYLFLIEMLVDSGSIIGIKKQELSLQLKEC